MRPEQSLGSVSELEANDEKFEKLDWYVEFKFIPWRGAYASAFPILLVVLALLSLVLYALSWMRRILTTLRRYLNSRVDELVAKAIESSLRK